MLKGDHLGIINILFNAKYHKIEEGPFGDIKKIRKTSQCRKLKVETLCTNLDAFSMAGLGRYNNLVVLVVSEKMSTTHTFCYLTKKRGNYNSRAFSLRENASTKKYGMKSTLTQLCIYLSIFSSRTGITFSTN